MGRPWAAEYMEEGGDAVRTPGTTRLRELLVEHELLQRASGAVAFHPAQGVPEDAEIDRPLAFLPGRGHVPPVVACRAMRLGGVWFLAVGRGWQGVGSATSPFVAGFASDERLARLRTEGDRPKRRERGER